MKRAIQLMVAAFLLSAGLTAKADVSVFGNTTNNSGFTYDLSYNNFNFGGGAVGFTPQQNLNVSSVTLWLSGYDAQESVILNIGIDTEINNILSPVISLSSTPTNNGSVAAFTFENPSGSTVLNSGTEYWLIAYGNIGTSQQPSSGGASWLNGGTPVGNAVYDGSTTFFDGSFEGGLTTSSSAIPAFTINTVPEPGFGSMLSILALSGAAWKFRRAKKDL